MKIHTITLVTFLSLLFGVNLKSQTLHTNTLSQSINNRVIEIRSYNLKPGTRNQFHRLFLEQALPLLKKWNVQVVTYGASVHDSDSYFLVRSYEDLQDMQQSEDAFYNSDDWKKGPRAAILGLIETYTTIVLPADATN